MNNITDLLDLEDSDIKISDIIIEGQTKTLIIETHRLDNSWQQVEFR